MKQFLTIFPFECANYLKSRVFRIVTLLAVLLIAVLMFFPRISGAETDPAAAPSILLALPEEVSDETAARAFGAAFPGYRIDATRSGADEVKALLPAGDWQFAVILESPSSYKLVVRNVTLYDNEDAAVSEAVKKIATQSALEKYGLSPEQASRILSLEITGETVNLGVDQRQNYFYTYIMIFALYMVILLYGQMVATGVATEKSSRAMELLITSAKPVNMMFGKVLAAAFAGFLQLTAVFGSAILFYSINREYWSDSPVIASIFAMPTSLFLFLLVFFILGFLIYAFLYGAVGSTVSKLEDVTTSVMPITMLFIAGFFAVFFSMTNGSVDSVLMKVLSYVPFTSPMAMFTRIAMSEVPAAEIALSIAILAASVVLIGRIAAKIYRVGVLMYGKPPKLGAILKAAWRA